MIKTNILLWNMLEMTHLKFLKKIAGKVLIVTSVSSLFLLSSYSAFAGSKNVDKVANAGTESAIIIPTLKRYNIDNKYRPQVVKFEGYEPGTIVIDPDNYFLYLVESRTTARRYGIAVGQIGLQFKGKAKIRFKREWPRWIPTKDMIARSPEHYARYENGMDGGPNNPLGARALYLYQGNKDTYIRIHGTLQPWSIGSPASNGCFRLINEDVIDLYERVKLGTDVVVL